MDTLRINAEFMARQLCELNSHSPLFFSNRDDRDTAAMLTLLFIRRRHDLNP